MRRFIYFTKLALPLLCLLLSCCGVEDPSEPPQVTLVSISEGQEVLDGTPIIVQFSKVMERVSINVSDVKGTTTLDELSRTATWEPEQSMSPGPHKLTISGEDTYGLELDAVSINFSVEDSNGSGVNLADLYISEFSLDPEVPTQGEPVKVRIGVYNKGQKRAGGFYVQWFPGENFVVGIAEWRYEEMAARGGRIINYIYEGYPSWYPKIDTKVVVDPKDEVKEADEDNNIFRTTISVEKKE
jgi:hypothetical protein